MKKSTILALATIVASVYGTTIEEAAQDVASAYNVAINDIQQEA